ncbi:MAG: hypothetical protein AB8C84_09195 [Oligoflexales bacterium]
MKIMNKLPYFSILVLSIACGQNIDQTNETDESQWSDMYAELELSSEAEDNVLPAEVDIAVNGVKDEASERVRFESENLDILKLIRQDLREQRFDICGIDGSISSAMREELNTLRDDESLTKEERKTAARSILDVNKDDLQAQREAFKVCREEQPEALDTLRSIKESFSEVCFAGKNFGKKEKVRKKGKKGMHGVKSKLMKKGKKSKIDRSHDHQNTKAALHTAIDSSECTQAIADHQADTTIQ